jgi:hypothetical protein
MSLTSEFEAAAEAATRNPAASEWILAFRKHPSALEVAESVLSRSAVPSAQMQACLLLRDVLVQSWDLLSPEQRCIGNKLLDLLISSYGRC